MKLNHYTRFLIFGILVIMLSACTGNAETENTAKQPENLVEIKDGIYTEYYPGKKQVKFQGGQDEQKRRNGVWTFFSEQGEEQSVTIYEHGLREGHTIVKYPGGGIRYRGEYHQDTMIGVWTTYDIKGNVITEKDYGLPK